MEKTHSKLKWMILILVVLAAAVAVFFWKSSSRTRFNTSAVSGNTEGNYFNNGLFCEYNGIVYFSNPYDKGRLYQMTPQGTEARKLTDDTVSFLNADEHYIYYVRNNASDDTQFSFLKINTNSLCRVDRDGDNILFLDKDPSLYAALSGNTVYYLHYDKETASNLYKVKIDGSGQEKLSSFPLLLAPSIPGSLCYNGLDQNHNIYLWDSNTDESTLVYEGNCWNPIVKDTYLYFMDVENDYHLTKVQRSNHEKTDISNARVDCYNIYGNYAYYQKNAKEVQGLYRVALDGSSEEELIAEGLYCDINITSNYVYFRSFKNKKLFYQTPTNGAAHVTEFQFSEAD